MAAPTLTTLDPSFLALLPLPCHSPCALATVCLRCAGTKLRLGVAPLGVLKLVYVAP